MKKNLDIKYIWGLIFNGEAFANLVKISRPRIRVGLQYCIYISNLNRGTVQCTDTVENYKKSVNTGHWSLSASSLKNICLPDYETWTCLSLHLSC